jgi:GNAT superfamily N-acetyltransferase
MTLDSIRIRPAVPADTSSVVGLIRELADFERLSHLVRITPEALAQELFGASPVIECVVAAPARDAAGNADVAEPLVAFALFFTTFSTFLGQRGLWLEDLYVRPDWRGRGVGEALLRHGARRAVEHGLGRYEWSVLDWNESAIGFYQRLGATVMPDWRICRVTGEALTRLGEDPSAGSAG